MCTVKLPPFPCPVEAISQCGAVQAGFIASANSSRRAGGHGLPGARAAVARLDRTTAADQAGWTLPVPLWLTAAAHAAGGGSRRRLAFSVA